MGLFYEGPGNNCSTNRLVYSWSDNDRSGIAILDENAVSPGYHPIILFIFKPHIFTVPLLFQSTCQISIFCFFNYLLFIRRFKIVFLMTSIVSSGKDLESVTTGYEYTFKQFSGIYIYTLYIYIYIYICVCVCRKEMQYICMSIIYVLEYYKICPSQLQKFSKIVILHENLPVLLKKYPSLESCYLSTNILYQILSNSSAINNYRVSNKCILFKS